MSGYHKSVGMNNLLAMLGLILISSILGICMALILDWLGLRGWFAGYTTGIFTMMSYYIMLSAWRDR